MLEPLNVCDTMRRSGAYTGGFLKVNIPWENKPEGSNEIVWRSCLNPIITRSDVPSIDSIYNSAVVSYGEKFAGVFRCDDSAKTMRLHAGVSSDGLKWEIDATPINFVSEDPETGSMDRAYDPRVCWIEDRYYVTWCNCTNGPTVGIGYTYDFNTFHQLPNAFLPFNRNGVLFPRKINGKYAMLSRPSDNGHTPFGDIYYSESPDMRHWGYHRHVMSPTKGWQDTKIGAGPVPIETSEGWLLIYHGVLNSCNGFVYSAGAALLDLEKPWKVIYRTVPCLLGPQEHYERVGNVPNVVFPCAALHDPATGQIALYYGAADTVTCLAYTRLDPLMEYLKANSCV